MITRSGLNEDVCTQVQLTRTKETLWFSSVTLAPVRQLPDRVTEQRLSL